MLKPSLDEFKAAVARDTVIPLRRRIPADLETPVSAFLKLRAVSRGAHGPNALFLLESVERGIQVGRYSFIGVGPSTSIRLEGEVVSIDRGGDTVSYPVSDRDPLSFVRDRRIRSSRVNRFP